MRLKEFKFKDMYTHIMTGVSYMLPFVVAGGILFSFAFLADSKNAALATFGSTTAVPAWLLTVGSNAFSYMLPILAAFIAYSISDKPGIMPGFVAGLAASKGGSGFLGALAGGIIAGLIILILKELASGLPRSLEGVKTLIIFPVIGLILISLCMIPVNAVVAPINSFLTAWLKGISGTNAVLLGAIIGGMLAIDMGGPINKVAYLFSVATLTSANGAATGSVAMGAAGCSAMVISTSCAVASTLFPKKFSPNVREAGKAAYFMGLTFIAEGAIPFAIAKPKAILPSIVTGAAVAGGLAGAFGITLSAPIGGIFTLPLTSNIPLYLLCFLVGTAVSVFMIYLLTKNDVDYE
jgi:fructose PTS system EIIBC or EIIC component